MTINKKWHDKNKMPRNPEMEERMRWHIDHKKNCACRPIPKKLCDEMRKRGIKF